MSCLVCNNSIWHFKCTLRRANYLQPAVATASPVPEPEKSDSGSKIESSWGQQQQKEWDLSKGLSSTISGFNEAPNFKPEDAYYEFLSTHNVLSQTLSSTLTVSCGPFNSTGHTLAACFVRQDLHA
jgi:hypothetical protein